MRAGYDHKLTDKEQKQLDENPSNFADIYIMKADGSDQNALTDSRWEDSMPAIVPPPAQTTATRPN